MKTNILKFNILLVNIFFLTLLFSCSLLDEEESDNNIQESSEIYYRWTENLNYPPQCTNCNEWCQSLQPFYNNTHSGIPNNAIKGQFYGPINPGSMTIYFSEIGGGSNTSILEEPPIGFRRYYTHKLKEYHQQLNRCVIFYDLTYYDEPMN
jgi:hypothetical protein